MAPAILGSLGGAIYAFVKAMTDYILKKKMIEKGYVGEETQSIFKTYNTINKYASLKWGLLFLTGGLSFIIMHALDVTPDSPLPYGIFTVSLSVGFLSYYFLIKNDLKG